MANIIKLPDRLWDGPREVEYLLPDSWQIDVYNIAGYNRPALTSEDIKAAVASPIGMPPLREIARGKKEVVIIFDDMARSTQTSKIVPSVLEELKEAGITDDRIRFIAAVANHQALDRSSLVKKLGEEVLARFPVYNHCPFLNCTYVGTTSYGTKVSINSEVMYCDLKITIGEIVPHIGQGFGGGGKIIVPGVAAHETVVAHHGTVHKDWKEKQRQAGRSLMGVIDGNPANADIQEMAKLAGVDFMIDCIVNIWGDIVGVFVGALAPTYEAAVKEAKSHYLVITKQDNDIVIVNNYHKANEAGIALANAYPAVSRNGGDVVLISNSPLGQVIHYLLDSFGKTIGGSLFNKLPIPPHVNRVIIYTEYPEIRMLDSYLEREKVTLLSNWNDVIKILQEIHGASAKVAVFPTAAIQYST